MNPLQVIAKFDRVIEYCNEQGYEDAANLLDEHALDLQTSLWDLDNPVNYREV